MVDNADLFVLTISPPCDPFSQLLKIGSHGRDPAKVEQQRKIGVQNVHTAIMFYRNQYNNNRYFLHTLSLVLFFLSAIILSTEFTNEKICKI